MKKGIKELDHNKEDSVLRAFKKVDVNKGEDNYQQEDDKPNIMSVEFTSSYVNVLFAFVFV